MNALLVFALALLGIFGSDAALAAGGFSAEPLTPEDQESLAMLRRHPANVSPLAEAEAAFAQGRWEAAAAIYATLPREVAGGEAPAPAPAVEAKSSGNADSDAEITPDLDEGGELARRYPLRRRCQALTELGRRAEALAACEALLNAVLPNAADIQAQIAALMLGSGRPGKAELYQASQLLRRVEGMDPGSVWAEASRCAIAARIEDRSALAACSLALSTVAPNTRLARHFTPAARESWTARWLKLGSLGALLLAALSTLGHHLLRGRRGALAASACLLLLAAARPASAQEVGGDSLAADGEAMSSEPPPSTEVEGGTFDDEMAQVQALVDKITAAEKLINEKQDWSGAVGQYNEIVKTAPYMVKAWRRLCEGYSYLGMPAEGAHCCRQALQSSETNAWDRAMLVHHLLTGPDRAKPEVQAEAAQLAADDVAKWPNERWGYDAQCELALVRNDLPALRACSKQLDRLAPDDRKTLALLFSAALGEGRYADAERLIERARAGGMDETTLGTMRETLTRREPFVRRLGHSAPLGLGLGAAFAALVLLIGYLGAVRKAAPQRVATR